MMEHLSVRPFKNSADTQSMADLLTRLRDQGQLIYPVAADVFEDLADTAVQESAYVWKDDQGRLTGFVYVSRFDNLVYAFDDEAFAPDVQDSLIDFAVQTMRVRNEKRDQALTLDAGAREEDASRIALLERSGFIRQEETTLLLARRLDEYLPTPSLPAGFSIRPMKGEAELEEYVALHRAAFNTNHMTVDYRRAIMAAPDYLPELDLVAVAPDGALAGFCVCQIFPGDKPRAGGQHEGWTDPLGTHPKYQYLGLAKALILTGLHLLKARGMDTILISTTSTNTAMRRTAESAGFHVASTMRWYSKTV